MRNACRLLSGRNMLRDVCRDRDVFSVSDGSLTGALYTYYYSVLIISVWYILFFPMGAMN